MTLRILTTLFVVAFCGLLTAQTTILDFETPATSTTFQYFGSSLEGQLSTTVANPNPSGDNTSATVLQWIKPAGAQTWAGGFSNPNPSTPIDVTNSTKITVMVHMDHIGSVSIKLEGAVSGGDNYLQTKSNTVVDAWEKIEFDLTLPNEEAPNQAGNGEVYQTLTLFSDFGVSPTEETITYIDNIVVEAGSVACETILDYETPETSTTFQYFGSTLEGALSESVANPNPTGINTSDNVLWFRKPANSQVWAGAFSNPNPTNPINLVNGGTIKIKVHSDHVGNLLLKLENSTTGGDNWELQQEINTTGEWVELSFDASLPSGAAPNQPATGHAYATATLFFDFGTSFTEDQSYYLDDFEVCTQGGPQLANVTFQVDMNQYGNSFTNVAVSGSFNDWSGDSNIMTDADGDGVYATTVQIATGAYEYKFTLDNWSAEESLSPTSSCTNTTYDGANVFTNRKLLLVADSTVLDPVCFNSCYECGEGVTITYNIGMNGFTPDTTGVYLAGGADFGAPSPRFRMSDDDGDGIYSISIEREKGYSTFYAFTNGFCPDFSCKENLSGQPCAQVQNFNDRLLDPVQQDTVVNTCYASCATNTDCSVSVNGPAFTNDWFELRPSITYTDVALYIQEPIQEGAHIRIFNATGNMVWEQTYNETPGDVLIPSSNWNAGLYYIQIEQKSRRGISKFIKY
jgi:hypothetical protein